MHAVLAEGGGEPVQIVGGDDSGAIVVGIGREDEQGDKDDRVDCGQEGK